jgi:uncharacterized protein YbgA (DUF1722 family)
MVKASWICRLSPVLQASEAMQKVIQHLMDFLTNHLSSDSKQELLGLIEDCRQGLVPLIVPLTLLKHHLNRYPVPDWVDQQVYLHPYPKELMLRNHV